MTSGIIQYPLSTEKSLRLMEAENKLIFIVAGSASKNEIKDEIEKMFKVVVIDVKTENDRKGRKKAYITFSAETPAIDVATNLGLM